MPNHHDVLFRETFAEVDAAKWLLRTALPEVPMADAPRLVDASAIAEGTLRQPDLIWQIAPTTRVRTAWQHQSTVDPQMDLRVLHDTAVILKHWAATDSESLPALITIVVTHAPRRWTTPRDVRERMEAPPEPLADQVVRCPYTLLDLADLTEQQLASAPAVARLTLALLRAWQQPGLHQDLWEVFFHHQGAIAALIRRHGVTAIGRFIGYLVQTAAPRPKEVLMAQLATLDPDLPQHFTTWADKLRHEGEARGLQRGRKEGRQEGAALGRREAARDLLLQLGEQRFGAPTAAQRRAVARLDLPALEALALRVLTAESWSELLG